MGLPRAPNHAGWAPNRLPGHVGPGWTDCGAPIHTPNPSPPSHGGHRKLAKAGESVHSSHILRNRTGNEESPFGLCPTSPPPLPSQLCPSGRVSLAPLALPWPSQQSPQPHRPGPVLTALLLSSRGHPRDKWHITIPHVQLATLKPE